MNKFCDYLNEISMNLEEILDLKIIRKRRRGIGLSIRKGKRERGRAVHLWNCIYETEIIFCNEEGRRTRVLRTRPSSTERRIKRHRIISANLNNFWTSLSGLWEWMMFKHVAERNEFGTVWPFESTTVN